MSPFEDFIFKDTAPFKEPLNCKDAKVYDQFPMKRHVDASGFSMDTMTRSCSWYEEKTQSSLSKHDAAPKKRKADDGSQRSKDEDTKSLCKSKKIAEPAGYIHVRARRGEATDSHSLAERVRRERISERMKLLQNLVPGCNNVTGKASILDEIINYVQSLQKQVEFLSFKLAAVRTQESVEYYRIYKEIERRGMENRELWKEDSVFVSCSCSNGLQVTDAMDPYNLEFEKETAAFQCLDFHGEFGSICGGRNDLSGVRRC